jgi:hypothetical protein
MAELTERQKEFIVAQLASYYSPSEVVDLVAEEFKLTVTRQQVNLYNPETVAGKEVSQKWKDLFAARRTAFLSDRSSIGIAHQNFRLREMHTLFQANKKKSLKMVLKIMEQAAKEEGGIYQRHVDEVADDNGAELSAELDAAIDKVYGESAGPAGTAELAGAKTDAVPTNPANPSQ